MACVRFGALSLSFAAGLIFTNGCATARLNRFHSFAQAGVQYVKASQEVLNQAGQAAIAADSGVMINARTALTPTERRQNLIEDDALLRKRLEILSDLHRHGKLLEDYFEALDSLADGKSSRSAADSAQGVFNSFSEVAPSLKNAKVGAMSVSSFIPAVVAPAVAHFRVRALETELKTHAKFIADEIALQEAVFTALGNQLKTDLPVSQSLFERRQVVEPFVADGALPVDWERRRVLALSGSACLGLVAEGAVAARKLRLAFTALVENSLGASDLDSLIADTNSILDLAAKIGNLK